MRVAILSDIHGNLPALEAVLADVGRQAVDQIVCLGDVANLGPYPAECIDRALNACDVVLQGNHELYLLGEIDAVDWQTCPTWAALRWARAQLSARHFTTLRRLPLRYEMSGNGRSPGVCVHASPRSQYLGFLARHAADEIAERMSGLDGVTLFAGHTHVPLYRRWSESWLVNVGSVGMPLDGTPQAKYVLATRRRYHWDIAFRQVTYDARPLMEAFERSGLQATGGVVTAVFRYQMLTGIPLAATYLDGLQRHAASEGVPMGDVYAVHPVPPQVAEWVAARRQ